MLANNINTTDTRFGRMSYFATDYYIGRSLELYGEYSWGEIELCSKVVKPNWTIVNGGANIGALTVPLAKLVNKGKVYAFEPQPEVYQMLKRNARRRKNLTVSDCALWHSGGDTRMRLMSASCTTANLAVLSSTIPVAATLPAWLRSMIGCRVRMST